MKIYMIVILMFLALDIYPVSTGYRYEFEKLSAAQSAEKLYGCSEWEIKPLKTFFSYTFNCTSPLLPGDSIITLLNKLNDMEKILTQQTDSIRLSTLNAQFIQNFINQDVTAHDKILHQNFVCIQGTGTIVDRDEYLKNWAAGYSKSGYTSFSFSDESIRIFGNMALVRSKTVFTKIVEGKEKRGNSIYTDTYVKENGKWLCVQVQITPVTVK